jgi:hypothetical protein
MGKILLIMLAVGVVVYLISLFSGSSSEEATANGCMTSLGCGYSIFQIMITVLIILAAIAFVGWIFS